MFFLYTMINNPAAWVQFPVGSGILISVIELGVFFVFCPVLSPAMALTFFCLSLGFTTLLNILGHQRRFRHRAWKVRQISLSGHLISAWGSFICRKSTTLDPWLYFPSEERLRIFTLWKNPSTPVGIEPANLRYRGEYNNHWTTGRPYRISWHCADHTFREARPRVSV